MDLLRSYKVCHLLSLFKSATTAGTSIMSPATNGYLIFNSIPYISIEVAMSDISLGDNFTLQTHIIKNPSPHSSR